MQEWPEAIIVGFGYKPSSPDELRLLSADITEGGPKRNLGTEALSRGTGRRYGAGGEDVATSSLQVTDGVPRCPSRTT